MSTYTNEQTEVVGLTTRVHIFRLRTFGYLAGCDFGDVAPCHADLVTLHRHSLAQQPLSRGSRCRIVAIPDPEQLDHEGEPVYAVAVGVHLVGDAAEVADACERIARIVDDAGRQLVDGHVELNTAAGGLVRVTFGPDGHRWETHPG